MANEIKELAKQTATATGNIKTQIEEIQQSTTTTVVAIDEITEIISGANVTAEIEQVHHAVNQMS